MGDVPPNSFPLFQKFPDRLPGKAARFFPLHEPRQDRLMMDADLFRDPIIGPAGPRLELSQELHFVGCSHNGMYTSV